MVQSALEGSAPDEATISQLVIDGEASSQKSVSSDFPQGTIIDPLMHVLYNYAAILPYMAVTFHDIGLALGVSYSIRAIGYICR